MPKIDIYNQSGKKVGQQTISADVFGVKPKPELIHQVIVSMMASRRRPIAHTKTRGEVRGGGKKPWRQKGTGRARAGSIRSPLWKGGGVTFGPRKERVFKQKINKKVRRAAILMCLSDKIADKKIIVLDELEPKTKTKEMAKILNKLPSKKDKTLVVLPKDVKIFRTLANIPYLNVSRPEDLNVLDLLAHKWILITKEGIKKIERTLIK